MFKLMYRLYDPQEGAIYVNGVNIKEYDVYQLRRLLGTVFQDFKLFHMAVAENLTYLDYRQADKTSVQKALTDCEMFDTQAKLYLEENQEIA